MIQDVRIGALPRLFWYLILSVFSLFLGVAFCGMPFYSVRLFRFFVAGYCPCCTHLMPCIRLLKYVLGASIYCVNLHPSRAITFRGYLHVPAWSYGTVSFSDMGPYAVISRQITGNRVSKRSHYWISPRLPSR